MPPARDPPRARVATRGTRAPGTARKERRSPRAAIIGSGFGGLAAAIRLQAAGFETVLFEARDLPGGRAYVYRDQGFTFDAGPTVITDPDCLAELFVLSGRDRADYIDLLPVRPFYRLIWSDGVSFDYSGDEQAMVEQIRALAPADVSGYRAFVDYSRRVFEKGYIELGAQPFLRFWDMVRVAPTLARLRADRTVYQTVARFLTDEHLRQAFSFHSLLVGGNPFETSSIYTLIHYLERKGGVFFPRGGTGALVAALVQLYTDLGGELRLRSPIRRIRINRTGGRATHGLEFSRPDGASGHEVFELVVSNADLHQTYSRLYATEPSAVRAGKALQRKEWSMSLFVLYFGTRRRYPETAHHTILFGPRYRELLAEIFHGSSLPEDFSLYLHAPTVTDPSLAPPGCEAFYVLSPVPHLGKANLDWSEVGPRYADQILESLERHLPDLRSQIVTRRLLTPANFESELGAYQGAAFSLAPTLSQSAWFRPHNRDPRIPGLYLVGAGTHPGAGIPGVVSSAKATANLVLEDFSP